MSEPVASASAIANVFKVLGVRDALIFVAIVATLTISWQKAQDRADVLDGRMTMNEHREDERQANVAARLDRLDNKLDDIQRTLMQLNIATRKDIPR